jgi:hypothetical protein
MNRCILCNQCLSPLKLWVRTLLRRGILDTTLCDKVCQWFAIGQWFSPGTPVSSTNKTLFCCVLMPCCSTRRPERDIIVINYWLSNLLVLVNLIKISSLPWLIILSMICTFSLWSLHVIRYYLTLSTFPLKLKKVACLIQGVWYKMLYHHTVVIKEWCDAAWDVLCWNILSWSHIIGIWVRFCYINVMWLILDLTKKKHVVDSFNDLIHCSSLKKFPRLTLEKKWKRTQKWKIQRHSIGIWEKTQ